MIQQSSLEAFARVKPTERYKQICEALAIYGDMSNKEISVMTGLPINSVTPRVLELRQMGIIKERGLKTGGYGVKVHVWGL